MGLGASHLCPPQPPSAGRCGPVQRNTKVSAALPWTLVWLLPGRGPLRLPVPSVHTRSGAKLQGPTAHQQKHLPHVTGATCPVLSFSGFMAQGSEAPGPLAGPAPGLALEGTPVAMFRVPSWHPAWCWCRVHSARQEVGHQGAKPGANGPGTKTLNTSPFHPSPGPSLGGPGQLTVRARWPPLTTLSREPPTARLPAALGTEPAPKAGQAPACSRLPLPQNRASLQLRGQLEVSSVACSTAALTDTCVNVNSECQPSAVGRTYLPVHNL